MDNNERGQGKTISQLPTATDIESDVLLVAVENPDDSSTIRTVKITAESFRNSVINQRVTEVPSSFKQGDIFFNNDNMYIAVTNELLKRVELTDI